MVVVVIVAIVTGLAGIDSKIMPVKIAKNIKERETRVQSVSQAELRRFGSIERAGGASG